MLPLSGRFPGIDLLIHRRKEHHKYQSNGPNKRFTINTFSAIFEHKNYLIEGVFFVRVWQKIFLLRKTLTSLTLFW